MSSAEAQTKNVSQLFSGVKFFLTPGLPNVTVEHLRELLIEHGAAEAGDIATATHILSSSDCFIGSETPKQTTVVTVCSIHSFVVRPIDRNLGRESPLGSNVAFCSVNYKSMD